MQMGGTRRWLAGMVGLAWGCSPGVVVFGHEAKPHVAGVAVALWSVVAAVRFLRTGRGRDLGLSVALAGLSFGTVLSMLPAVLIPVTAVVLTRRWTLGWWLALFPAVYFATNPYVLKHLVMNDGMLGRQLGNTTAMYSVAASVSSAVQTAFFLMVSLSPVCILVIPAIGVAMKEKRLAGVIWLLVPAGVMSLVIFVALAAHKPGEYARFGLLSSALAMPVVGYLAVRFTRVWALPVVVMVFHVLMSGPEVMGYWRDSRGVSSRMEFARRLRDVVPAGAEVEVGKDVAPYNTPPVDLWGYRLRRGRGEEGGVRLRQPPEADGYWRMSWADRGFGVERD
jgi:hypothetical protein